MKRFLFVAAFLLLGASQPVVSQELKIGFVNSAVILDEAPQAEVARRELEREFSGRENDIISAQQAAQELEEQLSRDAITMSDSERARQERDLNRAMRDLQRMQNEFREDLTLRKNEELGRLQRQVLETIQTMAREEGYDLILAEGVVYAGERVDLTSEVLERLEDALR
ncbi:MAG: OmpH family outer membrane protein [Halothiobacillaceae bacterium]